MYACSWGTRYALSWPFLCPPKAYHGNGACTCCPISISHVRFLNPLYTCVPAQAVVVASTSDGDMRHQVAELVLQGDLVSTTVCTHGLHDPFGLLCV